MRQADIVVLLCLKCVMRTYDYLFCSSTVGQADKKLVPDFFSISDLWTFRPAWEPAVLRHTLAKLKLLSGLFDPVLFVFYVTRVRVRPICCPDEQTARN